jgi:hypothetical protein
MDVTKMPAPAPAPAAAAPRPPTGLPAEQGPQSPANAAPIADRADIRPLDIPAALQILLAEVRAAFELQAVVMGQDPSETATSPPQAARALLQMVLNALPDESAMPDGSAMPDEGASMPAWNAVLARVETALQTGLDRGIDAVSVWRDVPPIVVDASKEVRTQVFSALDDDSQNPAWLRPEWAGLAPRFERFCRRRRKARRQLTDPDYSSGSLDDDSQQRT